MAKKIVCLDAGHGGKDSGAINGKRHEADDVLKLVKKVGIYLKKYVTVKYTRTKDIYESPSQKAAEGNAFKADLFVSIHRDCFSSDTAKGYSTLVKTDTGMRKTFADYVNAKMEKKIGFRNRGTKLRDDLAVLNQTKMPAVLCEVGFISNEDDNDIFDKKFTMIAKIIANGILKALDLGTPISYGESIVVGDKVKIKTCAVYSGAAKGKKVSDYALRQTHTVKKLSLTKKDALLKEINSWVPVQYLYKA